MVVIKTKTIPKPVKQNDEVDIIAASFYIADERSLEEGIQVLNKWGLKCRKNKILGRRWGYLAGEDSTRDSELNPQEPSPIKVFARGGWGAARLLEFDQSWQKGWVIGFSDVSAIHLSRLSSGFGGGIHGPLLTTLSKEPEWSKERLKAILFGSPIPDLHGETWCTGIAEGPLVACNLTVASHLLGSRHIPNMKGAILILEDVNEEPYKIDRMLTQWRLAGILENLAGLAFGNFKNCEHDKDEDFKSFELNEILRERSMDLKIPVLGNLPIGHCHGNAALPLGKKAILNGNKGTLTFESS